MNLYLTGEAGIILITHKSMEYPFITAKDYKI